jgi:hypothetical protein
MAVEIVTYLLMAVGHGGCFLPVSAVDVTYRSMLKPLLSGRHGNCSSLVNVVAVTYT